MLGGNKENAQVGMKWIDVRPYRPVSSRMSIVKSVSNSNVDWHAVARLVFLFHVEPSGFCAKWLSGGSTKKRRVKTADAKNFAARKKPQL